ncbi:MAG: signal peptide peptidase SppA [Myxococcota bacterium]
MFAWTLVAPLALAQDTTNAAAGHPEVPAATIAAEDGPGALWVNPANQAYDPDLRFGVFADRTLDGRSGAALAAGIFGQSLGVTVRDDGIADFSVDGSVSVPLPQRFAIGATGRWHLISRGPDFFAVDVAASWRPAPWLALSAVAQNIGGPDPQALVVPASRLGLALRPHRSFVLGAEYIATYGARGVDDERLRAATRVRVKEGAWIRGFAEVSPDFDAVTAGGALEVYFGGTGIGLAARGDASDAAFTGWIGTGEVGESVVHGRSTVAAADLTAPLPYEAPSGPLGGQATWLDTLLALQDLEGRKRYAGTLLVVSSGLGYARNAEVRERIVALERSGVPVTVLLTGNIDTGAYYAASAASHVLMHPAAVLDLRGVSLELRHFRDLLDELGIEAQVVRQAEFKTAGEMYTHSAPSPEQKEQLDAVLDDIYAELVDRIAEGRELDRDAVIAAVDGGPWLSEEAVEKGLIDGLSYPDELDGKVGEHLDLAHPRFRPIDGLDADHDPWATGRGLAVVYVDGAITSGRSSAGGLLSGKSAGSGTVVRQIDRARRDSRVRALVLRVDSPGGSAFASEEITRAVQRFKKSDKPVVVSMGGLAASGGYYVATYADRIFAHPATITGSIGVLSTKLSADAMMAWLGVNITSLDRGRNAGMDTSFRAWDEEELARAQALVDGMYARFKGHVEKGRSMEPAAVQEVARGRVWSGTAAAGNGLVDELGGFVAAIDDARERAGLGAHTPIYVYPPSADLLDLVGSPIPALRVREDRLPTGLLAPLEPWTTVLLDRNEHLWLIEPDVGGLK